MSQPRGVRRAAKQAEAQERIWDLGAGAGAGGGTTYSGRGAVAAVSGREYWKLNGEEWQK